MTFTLWFTMEILLPYCVQGLALDADVFQKLVILDVLYKEGWYLVRYWANSKKTGPSAQWACEI